MSLISKRKKRGGRSTIGDLTILFFLLLVACFMALPLVYAIVTAFKPLDEIYAFPPKFYVVRPTLENFSLLFKLTSQLWVPFSRYVFNSVFTSVVATVGHVIIASMAAYVLAKHNLMIRGFFKLVILALLFNGTVLWLPQYVIMSKMNIINTYWVYILPTLAMPLGLFLMKQFMEQIPTALIEAAEIEGAGHYKIFIRVVMPMVKPAWLTLIIFCFQTVWNSANDSQIFDEQLKVINSAISQVSAGGISRAGAAMAGSLFLMVPPILVFLFSQSGVVETMAHSGVKG